MLDKLTLYFVSTEAYPTILPEKEAFLNRVFEVPFEERSWKKLVNLDTLHTYCGGHVPIEEARQLDRFSRICKCFSFIRRAYFVLAWTRALSNLPVSFRDGVVKKQASRKKQAKGD